MLAAGPEARPGHVRCPYSGETLTACRHYQAVSEHGDFAGAGACRHAIRIVVSERVHQMVCVRRSEPA
jgi:hypothetical protein